MSGVAIEGSEAILTFHGDEVQVPGVKIPGLSGRLVSLGNDGGERLERPEHSAPAPRAGIVAAAGTPKRVSQRSVRRPGEGIRVETVQYASERVPIS